MEKRKGKVFFERGSWYHRTRVIKEDGTVDYGKKGGFKTEKEAEESRRRCDEAFRQTVLVQNSAHVSEFMLTDYLQYWLTQFYSARARNTSIALASYVINDLLLPSIAKDIRIRNVTTDYLDAILEVVARISDSAGNKGRELLNMALKDAVKQGILSQNPAANTKPYGRRKPNVVLLNQDKIKWFLAKAQKNPWYLEILLALFMGLRKGEIAGLKFSDFDVKKGTLRIARQVVLEPIIDKKTGKVTGKQLVEAAPKTGNSYRTLPVPKAIIEEIERRRRLIETQKEELGEDYEDHNYISCQQNGLPHYPSSFNTALTRLCQKNGLPHLTVHGLRHMYASILMEQGVPLVKVSALLGHSSVHTTFEYYCDVMDEEGNIIDFLNCEFYDRERRAGT